MNNLHLSNLKKGNNNEYSDTILPCQENLDLFSEDFLYHRKNMDKKVTDISIFVFKARSALKITQPELAEILGCSKGNVSGWENGRHEPPYKVLRKLSEMSGIPLPGSGLFLDLDLADMELIAMVKMLEQLPKGSRPLAKSQLVAIIEHSPKYNYDKKEDGNGGGNNN